jgi:hypothetical protein
VKKIFLFAVSLSLFSSAVFAESMSLDDQKRIITGYGIATGQLPSPPLTDEQKKLPPDKCGTSVVNDFLHNHVRLDPNLMSALGVQAAGRPDSAILSRRYDSPAGRFLIHYIDSGAHAVYQPNVRTLVDSVPDYVVMIARIADSMYIRQIDSLGYPQPPLDGFYPSGIDNRFDVYVMALSAQFYGLTYIDAILTAQTATSYMVIDNDYASIEKYANRPLDAARVTIAHEYFHAVQFGMDYTEYDGYPNVTRRQYWMEMSAVWMEEECYDEINDYYDYLPFFLGRPTISLQAFGGNYNLHPYGAGIFPVFLAERFGRDIIRDIWQRCASVAGPNFLLACEAAVRNLDTALNKLNLASTLTEFSVWNYFTGQYSDLAPTLVDSLWEQTPHRFGYEERTNYPSIPVDSLLTINSYPFFYPPDTGGYRPQYNGTNYLVFRNMSDRFSCFDVDTSATPDTAVPIPCDSFLPINVVLRHLPAKSSPVIELGVAVIYQLLDNPDSVILDRFDIPIARSANYSFVTIQALRPTTYQSISVMVTPSSNDYRDYAEDGANGPEIGYYDVSDTSRFALRPSAVLTPYPNPAVVANMAGRQLTFRFQVANDTTNSNITADPLLLIDLYTVAGEFVRTINASSFGEDRLGVHSEGIYETEWDMKNSAGKNVSSGVYLAYARLWDSASKKKLLAESKSKIALIR